MRPVTVLDILEDTAARLPDKVYLHDEAESVTYAQCRDMAQAFGYALYRALNGAVRRPVVLFIDKSCHCVEAMLGVLYSGNFYVPMDVKTPIDRLEAILQTVPDAVIVTTEKGSTALRKTGYTGAALVYEELLAQTPMGDRDAALRAVRAALIDTDYMYILFTSGSTGTPKGVAVMHRSVLDYIEAFVDAVNEEESDIHGSQTPLYVDMSLKDIYMAMQAGATVCLIPQKYFMSPKKLLQYLDDNQVTSLMWVPTAYRMVAQFKALDLVRPRALRKLLFSGEGMPVPVYRYWRQYYPDAQYIQQYGPTEITGACTTYRITRDYADDETIPIGKPFRNTGILLLDGEARVIPPSDTVTEGEICVYGTCLAAGYYNAPEKTAEAFVPNPIVRGCPSLMYRTGDLAHYDAEGNIVFCTRKDYQVKHGGRRIELGEVETAFQPVAGIQAVCCVHNKAEDKLVLYYVGDMAENELSLAVRSRIPKYMIPAEYHRLDQLPTLPNGKLDRKQMERWANEDKAE